VRSPLALAGAALSLAGFFALPAAAPVHSVLQSAPAERLRRIDFHTHLQPGSVPLIAQLLELGGIDIAVNLAGVPAGYLAPYLELERAFPGRILTFAGIDWRLAGQPDFGALAAQDLELAVQRGARGLKISKALGLAVQRPDGTLLPIDAPELDAVFDKAGELGVPVAIHVADPMAFWRPIDDDNERLQELSINPGWSYYGRDVPSHKELLEQAERRYARHPKTTFVSVHVGGAPEDLAVVTRLLERYENLYVDLAARVPELGRRPVEARAFLMRFQDRVLFGTDLGAGPGGVMLGAPLAWRETWEDAVRFFSSTWRFFETRDRQFEHPTPIQGEWKIDGVGLPEGVLRKIYADNAAKLLKL
jgi:predicted TIM-barrel fold metal-dependent hydrolase